MLYHCIAHHACLLYSIAVRQFVVYVVLLSARLKVHVSSSVVVKQVGGVEEGNRHYLTSQECLKQTQIGEQDLQSRI